MTEVQRFLWEADQLSYEPWDSAPTEHGARLLAPLGGYVSAEDYDQLKKDMDRLLAAVKAEREMPCRYSESALYRLAEELEDARKEKP